MSLDWTEGALREGLRCYEAGAYFEAHEHWELVWLQSQEPEKRFLQGLIQVAAAFHHLHRDNPAGTKSLLRRALRRLNQYPESFAGINLALLRAEIRLWLEALESPGPISLPPTPHIHVIIGIPAN